MRTFQLVTSNIFVLINKEKLKRTFLRNQLGRLAILLKKTQMDVRQIFGKN
jgi:translation elongation factor EF-G